MRVCVRERERDAKGPQNKEEKLVFRQAYEITAKVWNKQRTQIQTRSIDGL